MFCTFLLSSSVTALFLFLHPPSHFALKHLQCRGDAKGSGGGSGKSSVSIKFYSSMNDTLLC